jgi:predicted RNase H-like HicB family nuclease
LYPAQGFDLLRLQILHDGELKSMPKDRYVFPAIIDYGDDGISIEFPDLPGCIPCTLSTDEAIKNAKEAMGLHLWGMEQDKDVIPEPTSIETNCILQPIKY